MSETQKFTPDYDKMLAMPEVKEAEFQVLFEDNLCGVAYVAADGTFLRVNSRFAEILGYAPKEIERHKTWQRLTHPDDVEALNAEADAVVVGEKRNYSAVKRYIHKLGHSVYCEVRMSRVSNKQMEFVHFVKQASEIRLSDSNLHVTTDRNGNPMLQPVVPVAEFLGRNWKWVAGIVGPIVLTAVGYIGTSVANFYEVKAKYEVQQETIKRLQDRLDDTKPRTK